MPAATVDLYGFDRKSSVKAFVTSFFNAVVFYSAIKCTFFYIMFPQLYYRVKDAVIDGFLKQPFDHGQMSSS